MCAAPFAITDNLFDIFKLVLCDDRTIITPEQCVRFYDIF